MVIANVGLSIPKIGATSFGYVFFFSSRRRHTRFKCDWSSDVCSSDLGMRCSGVPNEHHVQDTFVFLPTGTIDRGTPKHDSVGTVLSGSIAHLIRSSPAGEAGFIPCPEEAGASWPANLTP